MARMSDMGAISAMMRNRPIVSHEVHLLAENGKPVAQRNTTLNDKMGDRYMMNEGGTVYRRDKVRARNLTISPRKLKKLLRAERAREKASAEVK